MKKSNWIIVAVIIIIIIGIFLFINYSKKQTTEQPQQEQQEQIPEGEADYTNIESSDDDFAAIDEGLEFLD